ANGCDSHQGVWQVKNVHVEIDTYSGFLMATPKAEEATRHLIEHCLRCFAYMGVPKVIKTDNGSGYTSKAFQQF
ncbi:integrase catalytic domain-containing protein, partial [Escherichia coli]